MLGMVQLRSLWPLGLVLFGIFLGASVTSLYYTAKIDRMEAVEAKEQKKVAEATLLAHQEATAKLEKERDNALKNYNSARVETARIATGLVSANLRLRIDAVCDPQGGGIEPTAPRLTPNAERAYIAHRNAIDDVNKLLDLCGVPPVAE